MIKKICLLVIVALILAGCSSGANEAPRRATADSAAGGSWNMAVNEAMDQPMPASAPMMERAEEQSQKILQTAHINMQSDRFDDVIFSLRALAPAFGGFIENAELYDHYTPHRTAQRFRSFTITLRVPREYFDEAVKQAEGLAVVRSSSQFAEDVTAQYYDLAGRLETKRIEEERVLDMINRAADINDLLALEERLGQIRTEIERFQSQLLSIDRLATFSTIHVHVTEVASETLIITSEGLGARISQSFVSSINRTVVFFQNILIFLAGAVIPLTFIGLLAFIGVKAAKRAAGKKRAQ
jgi:hypothetical protein